MDLLIAKTINRVSSFEHEGRIVLTFSECPSYLDLPLRLLILVRVRQFKYLKVLSLQRLLIFLELRFIEFVGFPFLLFLGTRTCRRFHR